jgi:O-antigen ligase
MRVGNVAMNRENVFQNASISYGTWSSSRFTHSPALSILTWLSLFGYLITLAMTQTVYSQPFMTTRWVMLGIFAASSLADMILIAARRGLRMGIGNGRFLAIYLLATFSSVIYAENWSFSGMRWASHAIMLLVLVIILPQIVTARQIRILLTTLKCLMAALVVVSWLFPASVTITDTDTMYKGVMGNANTMGHVAFIAAILFLQTAFTSSVPWIRYFSVAFAVASIATTWNSGARSSMISLSFGVLLLLYYYRKELRGIVLIGILLGSAIMVTYPQLPQEIFRFAQKSNKSSATDSFNPAQSRIPVWAAAYEGFKKRPLLGWGFGADSNIPKEWEIKLTSLGMVERDAVNDFLFMLEGCGIVGFGAYLLLIHIILKQHPSKLQRSILQSFGHDKEASSGTMALHHAHVVFFILPVCLIILNQFDNSALSAGNLISVTLWLCIGCASMLRREIS